MIRFVSIVIVIWGLVVQPLMAAAMPTKMMSESAHLSMDTDMAMLVHDDVYIDESSHVVETPSRAPCHEKSLDESSSKQCNKCDDGCAGGLCASSCSLGTSSAAFQSLLHYVDSNDSARVITAFEAPNFGLPSRIFHPPKHS